MDRALVLYWSRTGNTEKAAVSIQKGLDAAGLTTTTIRIPDSEQVDFFDYDLVCLGFPSYQWHPPTPVDNYLKTRFARYRSAGQVVPGAPARPGRYALIFCTYSGPHTGIREAVPAGKYAGQFFEHLGFTVADEWYILSEYHGEEELSTRGRMGDIRGLPDQRGLARLEGQARLLALRLKQSVV